MMLEVLNQQSVQYALDVTLRRGRFTGELGALAQPIHAGITNQRETLSLTYLPGVKLSDTSKNKSKLLNEVITLLNGYQQREMDKAVCLYGLYRDDLRSNMNDMDTQTYGSRGQQGTAALLTKLAEIELMNIEVEEYPILLLGDVLSEFDDSRQVRLLSIIQYKVQTFVTTISVDGIDHKIMSNAKLYRINQDEIIK